MNPYGWHHHPYGAWMFGPLHWVILIVAWIVWIVPLYRILGRVGINPFWAFVALIPPIGLVLLWIIAFTDWKTDRPKDSAGTD